MIDSDFFNNGSFRALTANEMQALSGVVDGRMTYVVMPSAESHFGIHQTRLLSDNTTIEEHASHILVQGYDAEYGINYLYGSAPSKADSLTLGLEYYKQSGLFVSYPSNHPNQIKTELAGYQVYPKTQKSDSISDTVVARTGLNIDSSFSTGGVNPAGPISLKKDLDSTKFILPPIVERGSPPESTFNGKATFDEDEFLSKNVKHLYNASRYNTYVGKFSDPKLEPVVSRENPKAPEAKVDDGYGGIIFPYNFAFSMVDQAGITVIKEETFRNYDQVGTLLIRQPHGLPDILKTNRIKTDKRSPLDDYDHPGFEAKGDLLSYSSECCSWNNEMIWIREDKEKSWFDLYIPVEHYSKVVDISAVKVVLAELDTPIEDVFKQDSEGNLTNLSEHTRYETNVSEVWDISYRYDTYGWEIENPPCHEPPGKESGSNVTYIVYKFKKDGTDYDVAKRWDFRFWGAEAWTDGTDYVPTRTDPLGDGREVQNLCKTFKVLFYYKTQGGIADGDDYRRRTDQEIIDAIEDTEFTREEHVIVGSNKTAEEEGYGQKEFLSTGFDLKFPKDYPGRKKISGEIARKNEVWVMPQEPAQSDPKPIIDTSRSCPSIVGPNTGRINELAAHAQASAKDIFASQPERIAANRSHGMPISLSNFTPIIEESVFSYRKLNEYLYFDDYACGSPCGEESILERKANDYMLIRPAALPRFYKYNDFHRPIPIGYPNGLTAVPQITVDQQLKKLFSDNTIIDTSLAHYTYQTWNKNINRSKIETALIEPSLLLRSDRVDANGLTMKASFENRYGDNLGPVTKETICGDGTIQAEERVYLPLKEFIDVELIDDWENRQLMIRTKWKWDQPISNYSRNYGNSTISYSWFRSRYGVVLLPDEVIDYINRTTSSRKLNPYGVNYIEDYKLDYQPAKIKLRLSWPIEVEDTNPSSSTFGQKLVTYEKKWLEIPIHLQIDLIGDIPAGALPLKED